MMLFITKMELDFSHRCRPRERLDNEFLLVLLERNPIMAVRQDLSTE